MEEDILEQLKQIKEKLGRPPQKYDLSSTLYKNVRIYCGGLMEVYKIMKWEHPNRYMALDGHQVLSKYECIFDNVLYFNNIEHEVDKKIDETTNRKYDFKVKNLNNEPVFIELAGFEVSNKERCLIYRKKLTFKEENIYKNKKNYIRVECNKVMDKSIHSAYKDIVEILIKNNIIKEKNIKWNIDYFLLLKGAKYDIDITIEKIENFIQETKELKGELFPTYPLLYKYKKYGLASDFIKYGKKNLMDLMGYTKKYDGTKNKYMKHTYSCKGYDKPKNHYRVSFSSKHIFYSKNEKEAKTARKIAWYLKYVKEIKNIKNIKITTKNIIQKNLKNLNQILSHFPKKYEDFNTQNEHLKEIIKNNTAQSI